MIVRLLILASALWASAAFGADAEDADRYRFCVERAQTEPDDAYDQALVWREEGGGVPARHCAALALNALGFHGEAARRLEEAALLPDAGDAALRAALVAQAGEAWLLHGDAPRAAAAFTTAADLEPANVAHVDGRMRAYALAGDWKKVLSDARLADVLAPPSADRLALAASAYHALGDLEEALFMADQALALDPRHVDALLERGRIAVAVGDKEAARKDFLAVLTQFDAPSGANPPPAVTAAQAHLEALDVQAGAPAGTATP